MKALGVRGGALRLAVVMAGIILLGLLPVGWGAGLADPTEMADPPLIGERITPDDAHEPGLFDNPSHAFTNFGSSVAVDGDTLVVGTAYDTGDFRDWAYVFERDARGGWAQTAKLEASDADVQTHSGFGVSVAIDAAAGVLVVGDPGYDLPEEENAGAVYVFEDTPSGEWVEVAKIEGPDIPGDGCVVCYPRFGWSVDVEGDRAVVGVPRLPDPVTSTNTGVTGAVHVLERVDGAWSMAATLGPYLSTAYDNLGYAVGISGDTIAAGATWGRPASGEAMGTVTILEDREGSWELSETLWPPLGTPAGSLNAVFGFSLDFEGESLVVGDPGWGSTPGQLHSDKMSAGIGAAYVYDHVGDQWELAGQLTAPVPHYFMVFGDSVGISEDGNTVVVGADHFGEVTSVSPPTGTAYVFQRAASGPFTLTAQLTGQDTGWGDWFGESSAVSGSTVVVGAPFDDNRRDGTPAPLDDVGTMDPFLCEAVSCSGPNDGTNAGSVYAFTLPAYVVGSGSVG